MNPARRRTLLFAVPLAALGALALLAQAIGTTVVDTGFIRDRLLREVGEADVVIDLEDGAFEPFARRVTATGVVLTLPGARLIADRVIVSGIPLLRHLFGLGDDGAITVGEIVLEGPIVYAFPPPPDSGAASDESAAPRATTGSDRAVVRLGRLRVRDGRVIVVRRGATDGPGRTLVVIDELDAAGVEFGADGRPVKAPQRLVLSASGFERVRADGLVRLAYDSLRFSSETASSSMYGLRLEPTVPDEEFFRRIPVREDRVRLHAPLIESRGAELDVRGDGDVVARAITADSIVVDVFSNKRIPSGPASEPPWLPNRFARDFEGRLAVDSILARGRITYRELPVERVREPARIDFEELDVTATGFTNAPDATPLVVDASLVLYGAPASVRLEIPLDADEFRMRNQGRVGSVDLRRLTPLVMPLEGIEIQSGTLEGMRYDIEVDGPTAGGTVWAAYRDLDVQIVNRTSGEGGLFDDIKSFVANNFVLEEENMPGEDEGSAPGRVAVAIADDDPFFSRLWVPLREGLMSIAK